MIKIIQYCDICGREIHKNFDKFYQMRLPERDNNGNINLSEERTDICNNCLRELYWKISEIKHPNRKCPD